jgi:hypothetical protein
VPHIPAIVAWYFWAQGVVFFDIDQNSKKFARRIPGPTRQTAAKTDRCET